MYLTVSVISNNRVLRPQNPDRKTARGQTLCRLLMLKQHPKQMSVPYSNLSYLSLRIDHSLLKNPLYCCSTVWSWVLGGHFMTMQPQKCCGVHQEEGNRTVQRKHLRVEEKLVSAAATQTGCQKVQHVTSEEVQCTITLHSSSSWLC